jgi:hypothetical protein
MRQDLISRCELFNRLATVQTLGEAYAVIQDMPAEEQRTGRWLTSDDMYETGVCSCCRYDTREPVSCVNYAYCPNCGAKMEAET